MAVLGKTLSKNSILIGRVAAYDDQLLASSSPSRGEPGPVCTCDRGSQAVVSGEQDRWALAPSQSPAGAWDVLHTAREAI